MPEQGFASHPENINKNGRPKKGLTVTDIIDRLGEMKNKLYDPDEIKTQKEILVSLLWENVLNRLNQSKDNEEPVDSQTVNLLKYLIDRIDGKPKETIDINDSKEDKLERLIEVVSNKAKNE
jgi:hypothetical protein